MKELQYKDMHFILSESGLQTEYRFMTMPLMGEISKFTLSHKADTENHSIVSDGFFVNETANAEFFEKYINWKTPIRNNYNFCFYNVGRWMEF